MDEAALTGEVHRFFAEHYSLTGLDPDEDLFGSGLVDSMALVMLVAWIEDRFKVKLQSADITVESFSSPRRIVAGLVQKLAAPK